MEVKNSFRAKLILYISSYVNSFVSEYVSFQFTQKSSTLVFS